MRVFNFVKERIKERDMFDQKVGLTYKGDQSVTTLFGGLVSTIILVFMTIYGVMIFLEMINRENTSKSINSIVRNSASNPETFDIESEDVSFAVYLALFGTESANDERIFNVTFRQLEIAYDFVDRNNFFETWTDKGASICHDNFPSIGDDTLVLENIYKTKSVCAEDQNFKLGGSVYGGNTRKQYVIDIRRCVNGTDIICLPDDKIDELIPNVLVYLISGVKYFDFQDYDTPIKKLVDDRLYYRLMPDMRKHIDLYLRKEEVSLADSIFPFVSEKEGTFYSFGDKITDFESFDKPTGTDVLTL